MDQQQFDIIYGYLEQHLRNELGPNDREVFMEWISASPLHQRLLDRVDDPQQLQTVIQEFYAVRQSMRGKIEASIPALKQIKSSENYIPPVRRVYFLRRGFLRYAAAVLLLLSGIGAYLFNTSHKKEIAATTRNATTPDAAPGSNKAVLLLADGRQITLDSTSSGTIAQQGDAIIVKLGNGQIVYKTGNGNNENNAVLMNTMKTPRGGEYRLKLPDGTDVWLNAESSISYPAIFNSNERRVSVTGEVYFAVAKNKAKPFVVTINNSTSINVLGTEFNINSYNDEPEIQTTLMEGSIKILSNNHSALLQPGEQVRINNNNVTINKHADIEQIAAWRNGRFNFDGLHVPQVMRQLSRWYNIKVEYQSNIPEVEFRGDMKRNLTLQQAIKVLEGVGLRLKLDKNTLVVLQSKERG